MAERMPEIRLGEARVQTETGLIRSEKGEAHLEPKSMAVLHFLVKRNGKVASRQELLDAVWPGIHVGDDSLTAAIIKIRRALGDDARNPAYIETIPKRGYRLISTVVVSANATADNSEAVGKPGQERSVHKILPVFAAVLAVLGVALYLVLPLSNPAEQQASTVNAQAVIKVMPFANVSGDPEQDYLALGISDTVLNDLALHSEFSVGGRCSKTGAQCPLQITSFRAALPAWAIVCGLSPVCLMEATVKSSRRFNSTGPSMIFWS